MAPSSTGSLWQAAYAAEYRTSLWSWPLGWADSRLIVISMSSTIAQSNMRLNANEKHVQEQTRKLVIRDNKQMSREEEVWVKQLDQVALGEINPTVKPSAKSDASECNVQVEHRALFAGIYILTGSKDCVD